MNENIFFITFFIGIRFYRNNLFKKEYWKRVLGKNEQQKLIQPSTSKILNGHYIFFFIR